MGWWKILAGNLRRHAAVGMEATLLCCPSCPQRFVQAGRSAPDHDGRAVARRQARFRQHRARRMPCRRLDGMLAIRSDRERGLGRHLEQAIVDCRFVLLGAIGRSDQAEHEIEMADGQQLVLALGQPFGLAGLSNR
jgi:hypothetical protein